MNNNKTNKLLSEILKWQKLQCMSILKNSMPDILNDDKKRLVYELTDGENSQLTIAKKAGVAGGTVSNWWNTWYSYGIVDKEDNRYKKIISLKDLGIPIGKMDRSKMDK